MQNQENELNHNILFDACSSGDIELFSYLVGECHMDINMKNEDGETILFNAVRSGSLKTIDILITTYNMNVNELNMKKRTPLFIACERGHLKTVKLLINHQASFFLSDAEHKTPLSLAIESGIVSLADYLFQEYKTLDVNKKDLNGCTLLYKACLKGRFEMVEWLIQEKKANIRETTNNKETLLHAAATSKNILLMTILIQDYDFNVNALDDQGRTPLLCACSHGDMSMVKALLNHKARLHLNDKTHHTALTHAIMSGNIQLVQLLIDEYQMNIKQKNTQLGHEPFLIACGSGNVDMVKYFLTFSANFFNRYPLSSLLHAISSKSVELVTFLIQDCHVNVNVPNFSEVKKPEDIPLFLACKLNLDDILFVLLINNADVSGKLPINRKSILHYACEHGCKPSIIKLLLEYDAVLHYDVFLNTPLFYALQHIKEIETIKLLITKRLQNYLGDNLCDEKLWLIYACKFRFNVEIIKWMLDHQYDVNYVDTTLQETVLIEALKKYQSDTVINLILDHHPNVNIKDKSGRSALHYACKSKHSTVSLIERLIEANADVNAKDLKGETPLTFALTNHGKEKIIQVLLDHQANTHVKCNKYRQTPLHIACGQKYSASLVNSLDLQSNINERDRNGATPLIYAFCTKNSEEIISLLLDAQAEVNVMDKQFRSPLHYACCQNYSVHIIKRLLDLKAHINTKDLYDTTPLIFALQYKNNEEVIKLLLNYNANVNVYEKTSKLSPLHLACLHDYSLSIVNKLLAHHANIYHIDSESHSPLHMLLKPSDYRPYPFP